MTVRPIRYRLPEDTVPETLFSGLESLGRLRREQVAAVSRTYLDTFDWRLYAAGGCLAEEQLSGEVRTCWRRLADGRLLAQSPGPAPCFSWDLPSGTFRQALEPLIEMRALLPVVRLEVRSHRAALLDKRRKTVLRFVIEEGMAGPAEGKLDRPLPMQLLIVPIKGFRKPVLQAQTQVEKRLGLGPAGDELAEALAAVGREPEDYSSKLDIALRPDMSAGEALRTILRDLLDTIERNLDGTRQDIDSEFLHDLRVAVRRSRSLFSQVKGVLPPAATERFRAEFKWLGQITGPTRDLDVYLLKLPDYRDSLPAEMQGDLQPLHDYLARHQKLEQRKLARRLGSVRCRRLLRECRQFLETPETEIDWPDKAAWPILELANRRTWKTYRQVLQEGMAISEDSPASALHELRITCKKLRYLMEFFQRLHTPKQVRKQIRALKGLQDNLGDYHDLEVQAAALRDFGRAMQDEQDDLPSETFMAMGVLIDSLCRRQDAERRNFAERFARFASPANRKLCRELFNPPTGAEERP